MPIVICDTTIVTSDAARPVHHDASIVVDVECLRGGNTTPLEIGTRVPDYAKPVAATRLRVVCGQISSDLEPAGIPEDRFVYSPALADGTLRPRPVSGAAAAGRQGAAS